VDSFYALNRIGAVSNMIHPLSAAKEIAFFLNFSHSKAILTLDQFYPKVDSIRSDLKSPVTILVAHIKDELPPLLAVGYALTQGRKLPKVPARGDGILHWDKFLAAVGSKNPFPRSMAAPRRALPSSIPAAPPAPPRAFCSVTSTSTPWRSRPSPPAAFPPSTG